MSNEREIAAGIIRGLAAGAGVVGTAGAANPVISGVSKAVELLLGFVATLVEKVGVAKASDILADLSKHPARPITNEELAEDVARVKRELGVSDDPQDKIDTPPAPRPAGSLPIPRNPFEDD